MWTDLIALKTGAMLVSNVRVAGVACSILQGRMAVLSEAPYVTLCSGLSGQEKNQQADKRNNMSGSVCPHDKRS